MPTHSNFRIQAAADPRSAEVFIYGDIGESWWGDSVEAKTFVKELAALDVDTLTVRIMSHGGSVTDGIAIYNAIKRHPATVTVEIDAIAASIASLIAMAGDSIRMADNALLMIHAPWGHSAGNSAEMRQFADLLDTYAEAMSTSYATATGKEQAEILSLLTDGEDHWYTAEEALAEGFVHEVTAAMPLAASLEKTFDLSRYPRFNTQASATHKEPAPMPKPNSPAEPSAHKENAAETPEQITARVRAQEKQRRADVAAKFDMMSKHTELLATLRTECLEDMDCTAAQAGEKILAKLAEGATPVMGNLFIVEEEADRKRAAAVDALLARAGVPGYKVDAANPYRGHKLLDLARASVERGGVSCAGMDQLKVVANAFTQSTSDFPLLLEEAMHKTLQQAYATASLTWSRFCAIGSVSDFRKHNRYRVGSLGNLDGLNELGEFKNKAIPDGEKASISAATVGNIINLSRQAVINDDLGAFIGLSNMLGRSAARTIEAHVYARLAENNGMGPLLEDGKALFHADHGNIGGAGALSVELVDAIRILMAKQKDVSGNNFLDLRPAIWLGPMGSGSTVRVLNGAEYDPETANKLHRPNVVRGLYRDIVDTPRLTGTRFYTFADPAEAPVLEVAFLDGNQEPYLEQQQGFDVDGARYKVRLDFGVGAIDYRGAVTNAGA